MMIQRYKTIFVPSSPVKCSVVVRVGVRAEDSVLYTVQMKLKIL